MKEMISIIVPVYNAAATLERCAVSLLGQTYENIEILLVNDGSKDDSLDICRRLAAQDSRIRVIDKPNGGVSSARNAGLEEAKGEFIMFCDSDDWVEPDWCETLYRCYRPEDLVVCEIQREDVPMEVHPEEETETERKYYLHHRMQMCPPYNKIFSRAVIEKHNIRFLKELSLGEDFVFCLTYLCAITGKVRFVYRSLYHYDTSNENSLSGKTPALSQCEAFYQAVTRAMEDLGATDETSLTVRDSFVAPHFERNLKGIARRKDISFREKRKAAAEIGKTEGFRNTCKRGIRWGNPIYVWLMRHGWLSAAMVYLIMRESA